MLILTKQAKLDVINFINNSYSKASAKKFFKELYLYLDNLIYFKNLGKTIHINNDSSVVKMLIYKQYKVFYLIRNSDIYILAIMHSKMNSSNLNKRFINYND